MRGVLLLGTSAARQEASSFSILGRISASVVSPATTRVALLGRSQV